MIPTDPVDRKLSKIEVLRLATSYIQHLVNQLNSGMYHWNIEGEQKKCTNIFNSGGNNLGKSASKR